MNRHEISLLKEALVLNGVLKTESGKLDEASFKRLLREAEEIEKKGEEIEARSGGAVGKRDGIALATALYSGIGVIGSVPGNPARVISLAIDATLAVKFLYDASQAINAISKLNEVVEGITGKDALSPLNQMTPFGVATVSSDLLSREDVEAIRNADPATKEKARQYAISAFQYLRRAIISFMGAIPIAETDLVFAGIGAALAMSKSFTPAMIGIVKAAANISNQFKTLHKYAQADTIVGRALRLVLNFKGHYNLGMVMVALDILEPGAGDELRQYVDPAGASRNETEREVVDAIRRREKEKMDSDEAGMAHRKRRRDIDAELEKERQAYGQGVYSSPDIIDVTPIDNQRVMQESTNAAIERWQVLSGIK